MDFDNRDDVIEWIYQNQLSRRNLTDEKRTYLIGKQYEHRKRRVGAPEGNRNAEKQIGKICPIVPKPTHEVIAQENNVSPRTVKYAEQYAKSVDNIAKTLGNELSDNSSTDIPATLAKLSVIIFFKRSIVLVFTP